MGRIPQKSTLRCAFCQGKGTQPGANRLSCIACGGSGRITLKQPYTICKECGGRGKKKGANLYCLPCHGKGVVEERRYLSRAESPILKMKKKSKKRRKGKFGKRKPIKKSRRKKRSIKSAKPKVRKVPTRTAGRGSSISRSEIGTKAAVKKERKSFFKKLLGFLEIL